MRTRTSFKPVLILLSLLLAETFACVGMRSVPGLSALGLVVLVVALATVALLSLLRPSAWGIGKRATIANAALLIVGVSLVPRPAEADCLSGPGSTGFQSGTWTSAVTLPNSATVSEIEGTACEPNDGVIGPLTAGTAAGTSGYIADYGGTHAYVSVLAGGLQVGTGAASSGGTAMWAVRVDSQPGYAGPSQIEVDLTAEVFVTGSAEVSGTGSAGGTYQSEFSIRPAAGGFATILLVSNGALTGASHSYPTAPATVSIDTTYVIQVFQHAVATASGQPDPVSGDIGSATAGGSISQSFGIEIDPAYADALLDVHFPIEDVPGGFAPFPGSAPILPAINVPTLSASGLCVLALTLTLCVWYFAGGRTRISSSKP